MAIHEAPRGRTAGPVRAGATVTALAAGAAASGALALLLGLRLLALVPRPADGAWQVDAATEMAVTAVGALVAGWLACSALVATVCVLARTAGARWRSGERLVHRFAPDIVRRALVLAVGAGIGLGMATGASAARVDPAPSPVPTVGAIATTAPEDLGWVVSSPPPQAVAQVADPAPTPSAPAATPTAGVPQAAPAPPPDLPVLTRATGAAHSASATAETVTVVAGDSLWAIATRHLPAGATDAQIAAAWPRWYESNRTVVGPDPGLIHPGQVLAVPVADDEVTQ